VEDNIKGVSKELVFWGCRIDVSSTEQISGTLVNMVMNLRFPQNVRDSVLFPDSQIGVPALIAG
jgi:hypothetical protein